MLHLFFTHTLLFCPLFIDAQLNLDNLHYAEARRSQCVVLHWLWDSALRLQLVHYRSIGTMVYWVDKLAMWPLNKNNAFDLSIVLISRSLGLVVNPIHHGTSWCTFTINFGVLWSHLWQLGAKFVFLLCALETRVFKRFFFSYSHQIYLGQRSRRSSIFRSFDSICEH